MYFFYADVGLLDTFSGLIAHTTLATPFVVIHSNCNPDGFRPLFDPRGRRPRSAANHRLLQGDSSADSAGHDLRCALRIRYLLRRGGATKTTDLRSHFLMWKMRESCSATGGDRCRRQIETQSRQPLFLISRRTRSIAGRRSARWSGTRSPAPSLFKRSHAPIE